MGMTQQALFAQPRLQGVTWHQHSPIYSLLMLEPWPPPLAKALEFSKNIDPKELKSGTQRKLCTIYNSINHNEPNWKDPKCPPIGQLISKM